MKELTVEERGAVSETLALARQKSWGIAIGLVLGLGLLAATDFLVFKGGERVGPHLSLLSVYLPGYSVTFVGGLIGFVYMFVIGYGVGRTLVAIYNRLTLMR
jgi:hypothetical protein